MMIESNPSVTRIEQNHFSRRLRGWLRRRAIAAAPMYARRKSYKVTLITEPFSLSLFLSLSAYLFVWCVTMAAVSSEGRSKINVVGICGSLRAKSCNAGLLRHAVQVADARDDVIMTTFDIGTLPLYNQDLDGEDAPEVAKAWKAAVQQADAIFFACPEYNYSMSGALKNALDWPSKFPSQLWKGKVAAIVGAGGGAGTARGQLALRQSGVFLDITFVNTPEVCIQRFSDATAFDADGNLVGEKWQERVENIFDRLVHLAMKLK